MTSPGYIDSYYAATANAGPERPPLSGDLDVDVCVIGGGFTGVSAALHLAGRGFSVAVLEAQRIGWGASGRNGGHVGSGPRWSVGALENKFGDESARTLWNQAQESAELVKELIAQHQIDCDLKHGILHVAAKKGDVGQLREECDSLRRKYGYDKARFVDADETAQMLGSAKFFGGVLDEASAHLHPLNYALGLATAAEQAGARIFEGSRVTAIDHGNPVVVRSTGGTVRAKFVVLGCNAYLDTLNKKMAGMIMPINNFVLATEPLSADVARALIRDDVAVQDTLFVINYWKLSGDNRLLFGGGETYSRKFPADIKSFVRKYMLRIYPQLADTHIDYAWGGTLAITLNRLPSFGRLADNVFYAQGYSGHGVPTSTLAGKLLAEAIDGDPTRFDAIANLPTPRFPGGMLLRWPGLVLGMTYYALRDRL